MRVFLPWRAANQPEDDPASSSNEVEEQEHLHSSDSDTASEESPRKRVAEVEGNQSEATETKATVSSSKNAHSAKRLRLDLKPSSAAFDTMTAGPVRSNSPDDSGDEKLPAAAARWPPLENEPQDAFSSPGGIVIRQNHQLESFDDPLLPAAALDEEHLLPAAAAAFQPVKEDQVRLASPCVFDKSLQERGLEIVEMAGDGNCLFRAVALQVYGDVEMHSDIRVAVCDFMERDPDHFGPFVDEPLSAYVQRKRQDGVHGNNPEIQAVSELFNRPVEVFTPDNGAERPLNIFQKEYATQDQAIRLSYHDGNHYNAVVDPLKPTAGLGLGMPGLKIGLADQLQVSKAVAESDLAADQLELKRVLEESTEDEVKRVMKESRAYNVHDDNDAAMQRALKESSYAMDYDYLYQKKALVMSDIDATNFELEQAILQSSLESYRRQEQGRKQRSSPTIGRRRRASPAHSCSPTSSAACVESGRDASATTIPTAAATSPVASAAYASSARSPPSPAPLGTVDEYPQTVQELVMNGFELCKVVRAWELFGDNFDDLLAFLMSTSAVNT